MKKISNFPSCGRSCHFPRSKSLLALVKNRSPNRRRTGTGQSPQRRSPRPSRPSSGRRSDPRKGRRGGAQAPTLSGRTPLRTSQSRGMMKQSRRPLFPQLGRLFWTW
ncbi:MAG: hypothetical protein [Guyuan Rhabd tick virus 1]|uniref:Uncharacterized protein n=1 Tax=Guyuan Rhabd tick virus 1 TaxID=2972323 RepID=A0A9E8AD93_9RHAB|nr:MAG: hypothetical protein [Guyuan Rhabd tick virus 1]